MTRHAMPQVRYAKNEGVHIAYEVVGNGRLDFLTSPWVNSMETLRGEGLDCGSGIVFEDRRARALKGVPGWWALYAVKA